MAGKHVRQVWNVPVPMTIIRLARQRAAPNYHLIAPRPQRAPFARRGVKEAPVRILPGLRLFLSETPS
jgi:hypothetical protein